MASLAKLVSDIHQHPAQNLVAAPSLKAPMHSFVVRIALRQHSDMSIHGKTAIGPTARMTLRFHAAVANKKINGHVA